METDHRFAAEQIKARRAILAERTVAIVHEECCVHTKNLLIRLQGFAQNYVPDSHDTVNNSAIQDKIAGEIQQGLVCLEDSELDAFVVDAAWIKDLIYRLLIDIDRLGQEDSESTAEILSEFIKMFDVPKELLGEYDWTTGEVLATEYGPQTLLTAKIDLSPYLEQLLADDNLLWDVLRCNYNGGDTIDKSDWDDPAVIITAESITDLQKEYTPWIDIRCATDILKIAVYKKPSIQIPQEKCCPSVPRKTLLTLSTLLGYPLTVGTDSDGATVLHKFGDWVQTEKTWCF